MALTGFVGGGLGCGCPLERLAVGVACVQVVLDRCDEIGYRTEYTVTDCLSVISRNHRSTRSSHELEVRRHPHQLLEIDGVVGPVEANRADVVQPWQQSEAEEFGEREPDDRRAVGMTCPRSRSTVRLRAGPGRR